MRKEQYRIAKEHRAIPESRPSARESIFNPPLCSQQPKMEVSTFPQMFRSMPAQTRTSHGDAHRKVTVPLHPPENENESKVREDSETKPKSQEGGKAGRTPHSPNGAPKISSETPQGADPHEAFHPDLVNLADEPTNVRKGERCPSSPTAFPSSLTEKDKGERVGTRTHRLPPALQLVLQVLLLCAALPLPQTLFLSSYSLLPRSLPRGN